MKLILPLLVIATLFTGCHIIFERPREGIDSKMPWLNLKLRYVSWKTGEEIHPMLICVQLFRQCGGSGPPRRFQSVLFAQLVQNGNVRVPNYVPDPGEDPAIYDYYLWITFYMTDTIETVTYMIHHDSLDKPMAPYGYIQGGALIDDRSEFPIESGGIVQIGVPFERFDWESPSPTEEVRFLKRIEVLSRSDKMKVLSSSDKLKITEWALSRLDGLGKRMGHTPETEKQCQYWLAIRAECIALQEKLRQDVQEEPEREPKGKEEGEGKKDGGK